MKMSKKAAVVAAIMTVGLVGCDYPTEAQKEEAEDLDFPVKDSWKTDERLAEEKAEREAKKETQKEGGEDTVTTSGEIRLPSPANKEPSKIDTEKTETMVQPGTVTDLERSEPMVQPGVIHDPDEEAPIR